MHLDAQQVTVMIEFNNSTTIDERLMCEGQMGFPTWFPAGKHGLPSKSSVSNGTMAGRPTTAVRPASDMRRDFLPGFVWSEDGTISTRSDPTKVDLNQPNPLQASLSPVEPGRVKDKAGTPGRAVSRRFSARATILFASAERTYRSTPSVRNQSMLLPHADASKMRLSIPPFSGMAEVFLTSGGINNIPPLPSRLGAYYWRHPRLFALAVVPQHREWWCAKVDRQSIVKAAKAAMGGSVITDQALAFVGI
ncbi:hypothetical protein B0H17DRAFT_1180310 [Mycena rosella]|uniref:Uncharacterized protein n=1 Tax=Mycena rosella TaxID=1033263 RepID=A0AAD7DFW8_MYCRO|nr:hypothetical protein B0H17DRAFT_1180310 [Mycena rosella]